MTLNARLIQKLNSTRGGVLLFLILVAATVSLFIIPPRVHPVPPSATVGEAGGPKLTSALSQTHFVMGEPGGAYLTLAIDTPSLPSATALRAPVDMVVVLDRSGSMADPRKLPFAKQAIGDLIGQLTPEDRFSLVSFDHEVRVESALMPLAPGERERLAALVDTLTPGGSTNIGAGLEKAREILSAPSSRHRRVLLLSDGEANAGITDPQGLSGITKGLTVQDAALSTIGLGLGFNETLLSSMADVGMGSYSYLEDLSTLGSILSQNLSQARATFAAKSFLEVTPGEGVTLAEAGGYPIEWRDRTAIIPTGELLYGTRKKLTLSFSVPTGARRSGSLAEARLVYARGEERSSLAVPAQALAFNVVEPQRRAEALGSVNEPVLKESWLKNNLGLMQRKLQQSLQAGKYEQAKSAISEYRRDLDAAGAASGKPLTDSKTSASLDKLDAEIDDAFRGPAPAQAEKRNRLAKKQHEQSLDNQRK